jgi:hypothetical protein
VVFRIAGALLCTAPLILHPTAGLAATKDDEFAALKSELAATQTELAATREAFDYRLRLTWSDDATTHAFHESYFGPRCPANS